MWRAEWSVLLTQYGSGDQTEKNEMAVACRAYGGGEEERGIEGIGAGTWGKETTWKTQTYVWG